MTTEVKIGSHVFYSLEEYTKAYIKKWYEIHDVKTIVDLNWVENDWKARIENPQIFKK